MLLAPAIIQRFVSFFIFQKITQDRTIYLLKTRAFCLFRISQEARRMIEARPLRLVIKDHQEKIDSIGHDGTDEMKSKPSFDETTKGEWCSYNERRGGQLILEHACKGGKCHNLANHAFQDGRTLESLLKLKAIQGLYFWRCPNFPN
jgi:hypothetical protein